MNKTIIIGNLTADPVSRTTPSGTQVTSFNVAVNKKVKGQDQTTYFSCGAFNKTGELCLTYLKKGNKVMVEGEISATAYMDRSTNQPRASLNIMVNNIEFLTPKGQTATAAPAQAAAPAGFTAVEEDQLPF